MNDDTLRIAMREAGFKDVDIDKAFVSQENTLSKDQITKNLYILLWNTEAIKNAVGGLLTNAIKKVANTEWSHSSWSPYSTGIFYSLSNKNGVLQTLFGKRGAFVTEDLNAMTGITVTYGTKYNVYRLGITETEFSRAVDLQKKQEDITFRYSFGKLLSMGIKLVFKKTPEELFSGFDYNSFSLNKFVCSTYVVTSICQAVPRLINWFRVNNFATNAITPANIVKIPGIEFLFSGNLVFEFDRWKRLYESKNMPLSN
jgi:hypothetical protein